MAVVIKGGVELLKALKEFPGNLRDELNEEIDSILRPIVTIAQGYIPVNAPLSGWGRKISKNPHWVPYGSRNFPIFNSAKAKDGIKYTNKPGKVNKQGFRSLYSIVNKSPGGAIFETAGRKTPGGRPQAPYGPALVKGAQNYGKSFRSQRADLSASDNPNAGMQFISAMGPLYNANSTANGPGRRGRNMTGRAIYRAWKENHGLATAAVLKAIHTAELKFKAKGMLGAKAKPKPLKRVA